MKLHNIRKRSGATPLHAAILFAARIVDKLDLVLAGIRKLFKLVLFELPHQTIKS